MSHLMVVVIEVIARNINVADRSLLQAGIDSSSGNLTTQAGDLNLDAIHAIQAEDTRVSGIHPALGRRLNGIDRYIQQIPIGQTDRPNDVINNVFSRSETGITFVASGIFANTESGSSGNGGRIRFDTGNLALQERGTISAQSQGTGNAGNIRLNVDDRLTANNSNILTSATNASGGAIAINADQIQLTGDSDIRTEVRQGQAEAGNITINADDYITVLDDSDILAFANQQGGQITLDAPGLFVENYEPAPRGTEQQLDRNNQVDINANAQQPGRIETPETNSVSNSLADLSDNALNTDRLLANSCIVRDRPNETGQFFVTGTGSLPQRPGNSTTQFPTGTIEAIPPTSIPTASERWQPGDPIVEPDGVYQLPDGRLIMSRECAN